MVSKVTCNPIHAAVPSTGGESRSTILIVNDNQERLDLMSETLKRSGYSILTSSNSSEGLALAEDSLPDLIISAVSIPIIDSIDLCRSVREARELYLTPILLVSDGPGDSKNAVEGLEAGADDYLEIPYDPMRLIAKVARLIERRNAEAALKRSEERFRALIENSSDIITIVGSDGSIRYESPSVTRLLGYRPEELIGRNVFEFVHPDDTSRVTEAFKESIEMRGESRKVEYRFRHKNGSWRELESYGKAFIDEAGALVGVVNSRDVTERYRAERAARFHSHLLDTVEQAVIATNLDGNVTYWNRFAEKLYGWSSEEVLGRSVLDITPSDLTREQSAEIMSNLTQGRGWSGEFLVQRKDGTTFPAMVTDSPVYDSEGALVGAVGISFDLTERKRAQDALRMQKEILQKIFDHIPVMVSLWNEEGRLLLANRKWEQTLGWTLEEIVEQNVDIVATTYPNPDDQQKVRDYFAAPNDGWFYARPRLRDGRVIDTAWALVQLTDGTSISIGQDVTERKLAEEQLKSSNEKLRALSARLLSAREEASIRIAREIHDELGGALTGLKMDVSWLCKRVSGSDPEANEQKLRAMSDLIDETIQKVRNISTELRPPVLDDLGLAAAIEWQAREFERRTEIECKIRTLQEVVPGTEESTAIFRIFQEILTNVARHAQATKVEISIEESGADVVLRVSDNGCGIKETDLLDTKSLGLLGMRERGAEFGGRVDVVGTEGKGTTVSVTIPRK